MVKTKRNYYYYLEHGDCYILKRPSGGEIAFLQGDDARIFEESINWLDSFEYPIGVFETRDQHLSAIIDQYDLS